MTVKGEKEGVLPVITASDTVAFSLKIQSPYGDLHRHLMGVGGAVCDHREEIKWLGFLLGNTFRGLHASVLAATFTEDL